MEPDPRDERGREWLDGVRPPCLPLGRMLAGSKMLRGPASGFASASAVGNAVSNSAARSSGVSTCSIVSTTFSCHGVAVLSCERQAGTNHIRKSVCV